MARVAVVAVEAVPWMKGVKTLVEGRKIEVLVDEVGLRDTVDVRGAVGAVGNADGFLSAFSKSCGKARPHRGFP